MKKRDGRTASILYAATLLAIAAVFLVSVVKTTAYNNAKHHTVLEGPALFTAANDSEQELSVRAEPRSSTWTKLFDLNGEGLTEPNYQAYTYDFLFSNNTRDTVEDFTFRLTFHRNIFLASAWNGALEVHQHRNGGEVVSTIPDMRVFAPEDHPLESVTFDGESFVYLRAGDSFEYLPSTSMNAMEVPIKPLEGTTPGFILYAEIGETVEDSTTLELSYTLHRALTSEPLFWVSLAGLAIWLTALIVYAITSAQISKYNKRHERDNKIINESIETFTGFIDAKDPYTNGHSKRVASYTRRIAQEMGYEGEALERIYYIALLHDCGKIGVPDSILGKPGKLTDEEFQIIKSHTVRGGEILHSFKSLENVEEGARYHHERYDGRGYPEGLVGEEIPLIARMICVADSFDAMNTNRVYRTKLTREKIISEIETNRGLQFDPNITDIMLGLLRSGEITIG